MAKPVADTNNWGEAAAGFVSDDSLIQGFSQLHDSGKFIIIYWLLLLIAQLIGFY